MGISRFILLLMTMIISQSLLAKEIVVGIEPITQRKIAVIFTPIVLPDLISAKAAFEYRIHKKFNLVIPLEVKWMDYRRVIKFFARAFKAPRQDIPESWYGEEIALRPLWNIDFSQFKISTGIGAKWFPFSEAMTSGFFVKSTLMVGVERFNSFHAEGIKDSGIFTHVVTAGYHWIKRNGFNFGFEIGEEYTWHTSPIKELPALITGFMPIMQFSLGFTI